MTSPNRYLHSPRRIAEWRRVVRVKKEAARLSNMLLFVLRVLDAEDRLLERADQKALSLLSALGVLVIFFILYHRVVPSNAFTVIMLSIYFTVALMAAGSFILTAHPRISIVEEEKGESNKSMACEPVFLVGICTLPTLSAYRQCPWNMIEDEASAIDVCTRQISGLTLVNAVKYRNINRAILRVIIALAVRLALVAYLFICYHA